MNKWIKGYEGSYKIDKLGKIESVERFVDGRIKGNKSKIKQRIMKFSSSKGYFTVGLQKDGKVKRFMVHRLVYMTFVGDIPKDKQINHIDGNKINNSLDNLEVCTAKENTIHAWRTGLCKKQIGEKNSCSKLTNKKVKMIKKLAKTKSQYELSKIFNCHQTNIHYILIGKTWNHVKE